MNNIEKEIQNIKKRNQKVEIDKAWETSLTRKTLIIILTYIIVLIFFLIIGVKDAFVNAIVPVLGFILSSLSLDFFKKLRIRKHFK